MLGRHLLHHRLDFLGKRVIQHLGVAPGPLELLLGQAEDGEREHLELVAGNVQARVEPLLGVPFEELGQGLLDAQPGVLVVVPGAVFRVEGGVEVVAVVAVEGGLGLEVLGGQDGVDGLLARVLGGVPLGVGLALVGGAGLVLQPARGGDGRRAGGN
ncbi:hypothetical protein PG985_011338 [Apiospora marii]|uniref:Uncharacterized protein n=1 Tax=Apiospora marii TaxID=335849 RepID=A0ABR1SV79_9PEZI